MSNSNESLLAVLERMVKMREGMYRSYPRWAVIVPLLIEGKTAEEIMTITKLSPRRYQTALDGIEKFDAVELHQYVEKLLANRRLYELVDKLPRLNPERDEDRLELAELFALSPPEVKAQINAHAVELGLMPTARHCDADGNPLFSVQDVADHMGLDVAEVETHAHALRERLGDASGVLVAQPGAMKTLN